MQDPEPDNPNQLDEKMKKNMLILALVAFGSIITIFVYLRFLG